MSARTDTTRIPVLDGEAVVIAGPGLWTTTTYRTPHARLRRLGRRVARSEFAGHLRAASRAAFWPSALGCGYIVGLAFGDVVRAVL